MFGNLSEVWVAIILSIGVLVVIGRWIYAKTTGKELVPGDSNILANLRSKIVKAISDNKDLIQIEKTQGRQAVRDEIERQINAYIESATMLTVEEKDLLISLDKDKLILFIENELIRLGVLKGEK